MDIRKAGIISHAMHSRLQLVRAKIYCRPNFTIDELIDANRELFQKASDSTVKWHDLAVYIIPHWREAAQMFLLSSGQAPKGMDS